MDAWEVKQVLHMIEAQDVEGLREMLNVRTLAKYGLLENIDGSPVSPLGRHVARTVVK